MTGADIGRGKRIDSDRWTAYMLARKESMSKRAAAAKAGVSYSTIMKIEAGTYSTPEYRRAKAIFDELNPKEVVQADGLSAEARRALDDFAYFRLRYFGWYSTPWQIDAAEQIVELLRSPEKEHVVINVPPGAGKSSCFTFHIPIWLICRNRAVRIMIGSATERTASSYGRRIRTALERSTPMKNDSTKVAAGIMADAEATLVEDFGMFKPANRNLWRAEEFIVEQATGQATDEKEATVATYGRDGGFLGGRFDFIIWDDLVTKKTIGTVEARENLIEWWDSEAETRLEPGGCLVLNGQRLHANDLYRYCLDKTASDLTADGEEVEDRGEDAPSLYRHIVYKAHHTEVCDETRHRRDSPAYDPRNPHTGGCMLDPKRLPFREMENKRKNNTEKFLVNYQQEDVDPAEVLVDRLWVTGGTNPETGESFPGVFDQDRSTGTLPPGLTPPWEIIVSADPSPTKYWSVQAWMMHIPTDQRILIDHYRGKLDAPDFLGWDINNGCFTGLLEGWWQAFNKQGRPFRWVIVEQNAAQRFLLQYDHVKKWMAARSVQIIGHNTYGNKTDDDYGVRMLLRDHWKYGRVRLPGNRYDGSRGRSMALVDEATRWPESNTEDCIMAEWFAEFQWQRHIRGQVTRPLDPPRRSGRPSWLGGG